MKAPTLIHRALVANGFAYRDGRYYALVADGPLIAEICFDRCDDPKDGYLLDLMIFYPSTDSAVGILPLLTTFLRADGKLWWAPDRSERDLYFYLSSPEPTAETMVSSILSWLDVFADGEVMVKLADHLMGRGVPPEHFHYLADSPFPKRQESVFLLQTKVCYLNYLGRFEEALQVLGTALLVARKDEPFVVKLNKDARSRVIATSPGEADYLRELGLRRLNRPSF